MIYNIDEIIIQNKNMKIDEIVKELRPRERLIKEGTRFLSDIELLAILLSFGTKKESVIELSTRLIKDYGLNRLLNMTFEELCLIDGIKEAKATKLMACFELAKRSLIVNTDRELYHSFDVYEYVKKDFYLVKNEMFMVVYVNSKQKTIKKITFDSDLSFQINVSIRSIVKEGLAINAYGVFLIHNHPSNELNPSINDIKTTKIIYETLKNVDIFLLDHLIVGIDKYYSFYENKLVIK